MTSPWQLLLVRAENILTAVGQDVQPNESQHVIGSAFSSQKGATWLLVHSHTEHLNRWLLRQRLQHLAVVHHWQL